MAPPALTGSEPPSAQRSDRSWWRLRNWRLRTKLAAVLLVPVALAVALGGIRVADSLGAARELDALQQRVGIAEQAAATVHELQRERSLAADFVARSRVGDRTALDEQIRRVDTAVAGLGEARGRLDELPAQLGDDYDSALARLDDLGVLRATVGGTAYPDHAVITAYSDVIDTLLAFDRSLVQEPAGSDSELSAETVDSLSTAKEHVGMQRAVLLAASLRGTLTGREEDALRGADAHFDASITQFSQAATPAELQLYSDTVAGPDVDSRERYQEAALVGAAGDPLGVPPAEWDRVSNTHANLLRQMETALLYQLRSESASLATSAERAALRDSLIVLVLVTLAMMLLFRVATSLLRPLRVLQTTAFDVADRRLPEAIAQMRVTGGRIPEVSVEPVPVHSREEVGQVARAFDAVHSVAVRLSAEQALLRSNVRDIFANLSRRSQGLVERQVELIDRLERSEQNPEQLANLFELDHLATRMRRNSENLLVLAGGELRQHPGRPVELLDVLRAAISEVENYPRVMVKSPPAGAVKGLVVKDLVHLVAELLDNATSYSPPDTKVVMSSMLTGEDELVLEIADSGIGMSADELREVNERLAAPPVIDVSVSRRMGLFVVSRLAARHDITVRLRAPLLAPGLTAIVTVPSSHVVVPVRTGSQYQGATLPGPGAWPTTGEPGSTASTPSAEPAPAQLPMQVGVVDAGADDLVSPTSVGTACLAHAGERTVEQEWDDLFSESAETPLETSLETSLEAPSEAIPEQPEDPQVEPPEVTATPAPSAGAAEDAQDRTDDRSGHSPIFAQMVSAWFVDQHSLPAHWQQGERSGPDAASGPDGDDVGRPASAGWQSAADQGWQAAEALRVSANTDLTDAGLPRRRPRAHLVPGAAGPSGSAPATVRSPARSATTVRGRLTGYQQGLRAGRDAPREQVEQDGTEDSHGDEERE